MNPFFPLGSLTTYIKHFEMQAFVSELGFNDTRGFDSGSEYVLQKSKQIFVNMTEDFSPKALVVVGRL